MPYSGEAMGRRFLTLDAFRGVAALMVVLMHFQLGAKGSGFLAVDLFFILSGFVIGHAYEARMAEGMTVGRFVRARLIRLYPTLLFAILMMVGFLAAQAMFGTYPSRGWLTAATVGFSLFMLPTPPEITHSLYLFPLNGAVWSLFWELVANLLYALAGRRMTTRVLMVIAGVFAGLMVLLAIRGHGINGGSEWRAFSNGLIRTGFGFTLGLLGHRLLPKLGPGRPHALIFVGSVGMLAVALLATPFDTVLHLALVFVGFPLLLLAGAHIEPPKVLERAAEEAGKLSYTLYLTHQPLWMWMMVVGGRIVTPEVARSTTGKWVTLAAALLLAFLVERLWEKPLRRWLSQFTFGLATKRGVVASSPNRQPVR
jgi:peptidoglycan/LPS O-acetylase OafA/YrhL